MTINISWTNYGSAEVGRSDVYRSDDQSTVYDPGNKIGEIPAGGGTFADNPPMKDKVYYYGVDTETSLGMMKSKIIPASDLSQTIGPGGLTIRAGTAEFGVIVFDSTLSNGVPIGSTYLRSKVPTSSDLGFRSAVLKGSSIVTLVKFIRNGKIVLMPNCYQDYFICQTQAKRNELTQIVQNHFLNGETFDFMGYSVKYDLLTREEYMQMHLGFSISGGVPSRISPWMITTPEDSVGGVIFRDGNNLFYGSTNSGQLVITDISALGSSPGIKDNYIGWVLRPVES